MLDHLQIRTRTLSSLLFLLALGGDRDSALLLLLVLRKQIALSMAAFGQGMPLRLYRTS